MSENNSDAGSEREIERDEDNVVRRKRRSSNYVLEQKVSLGERDESTPREDVAAPVWGWEEVKAGFVSPEQAIEHITKARLVGRFRAVRVASAEYEAKLMTPEPVLTVKRIKRS